MEIVELQNGKYAVRKFFFFNLKHIIFFDWGYRNFDASMFITKDHWCFERHCTFYTYEEALKVLNMKDYDENFKIKKIL